MVNVYTAGHTDTNSQTQLITLATAWLPPAWAIIKHFLLDAAKRIVTAELTCCAYWCTTKCIYCNVLWLWICYSATYLTHTHTHAHTHTHTHTTVLWLFGFCPDNPGEPVPEERLTHSHLSWSSIVPYLLPSNTIHGILPVQSTCLTVFFHSLSPSFLWSTSWPGTLYFILHTFRHLVLM